MPIEIGGGDPQELVMGKSLVVLEAFRILNEDHARSEILQLPGTSYV